MESRRSSPTIRRRRLSAELRQLRESVQMTIAEASRRLEWASGKLSRIETNQWKLPSVRDVRDLLDLYEVTDAAYRDGLVNLARESRKRGWWQQYNDMFSGAYLGLESEASSIRYYEDLLIPGLLQTRDYATALMRGGGLLRDEEVARRVQARMDRQALLTHVPRPRLWAIIDEAATRKLVGGPAVMAAQLRHIIDAAGSPDVVVQVIPDSAGAHPGVTGRFTILDFSDPQDASVVHIETSANDLLLEEPTEVDRFGLIFQHLCGVGLSPEASLVELETTADRLERAS